MPGNDAPWRKIYQRALDMRTMKARVGVLAQKGGSANANGTDISLVELAAIHEFGSPAAGIPERSFLRSTFLVRSAAGLKTMIEKVVKAILLGKIDVKQGINMLGAWGAAQVKDLIVSNESDQYGEFPYPALADSTIASKGSSVPLIDTGQLLNAITWVVVDEKGGDE